MEHVARFYFVFTCEEVARICSVSSHELVRFKARITKMNAYEVARFLCKRLRVVAMLLKMPVKLYMASELKCNVCFGWNRCLQCCVCSFYVWTFGSLLDIWREYFFPLTSSDAFSCFSHLLNCPPSQAPNLSFWGRFL